MKRKMISLMLGLSLCSMAWAQSYVEDSVKVQGHMRKFVMYLPAGLKADAPLVFVLHGYSGKIWRENPLIHVADKHGFGVCIPQGLPDLKGKTSWNVGYPFQKGWKIDDVKSLCRMARYVQKKYHLRRENTFMTGMSNGGEMCYLMAHKHPEKFTAIVSLAGLTMEWIYRDLTPRGPVPFIEIHGTADMTSHWEGDPDNKDGWGEYIAVPHAVGRIISADCCTHEVCDTLALYRPESNTVVRHRYLDGTDGAEVRLYEILGGKHKNGSADMNVPEVLWEFFSSYFKD